LDSEINYITWHLKNPLIKQSSVVEALYRCLFIYICKPNLSNMTRILFLYFLIIISFRGFSQQPAFEWVSQCGNPPNTSDTKTVLAAGQEGQFYLAGEFLDTTQFGEKMLISSGGTDIFLAKYTAEGNPVWAIKIGASDYDYVQKVYTDPDGNVIMAGYFYGDTQIGPDHYTSFGSQDIFIAKFSPDGAFLWSRRAGGQSADFVSDLAHDGAQNVIITGYYYNSLNFDDTTLISSGSSDIFIAKFNAEGDLLWATSAGGSSSDQSRSASCDPEGKILVSGSFYYDITLGDTTISTVNPVGAFVARYFPDGTLDRAFQLEGTYLSTENYVEPDQDGGFYLSGNFSETINFGDTSFEAGEFNQDIYLAKYNSALELVWARHAFSIASDQVIGVIADQDDNVYLTGHYLDTVHFEQAVLPYTLCCGSREIFIVKYDTEGNVLWGQQVSGARASVQSLALNSQDRLLLSGLFTEDLVFGALTLSNYDGFHNYISSLETDVFASVTKFPEDRDLIVYPNPATNTLRLTDPVNKDNYFYRIYTVAGGLVISGKLSANENIDITSLPAGQYLLQLADSHYSDTRFCLFIKQ
jgi:hypothetical protein